MFSVIFPGQGSQIVGMGKELSEKFDLVKTIFREADEVLNFPISKIILEGPKEKLDLTENTQPAIFLMSYTIFNLAEKEFGVNLHKANFFAGHSLGEYSALACAGSLNFADTIKILKIRGKAMQESVPKGIGGMIAVLGSNISLVEKIISDNKDKYECYIANDNSVGQIVVSGNLKDLGQFSLDLKKENIKFVNLAVSAPFHCKLMNNATKIMAEELEKLNFNDPKNKLISNVTAKELENAKELKHLLVQQIENRVRWRESILLMINKGVNQFIEIGPGKVLSGLIKRINRTVKIDTINNLEDIENLKI